ncbi:MAG: rhodanese-like domain-containing protein [Acidobacteriota bacterium]|nr:MAG: rhodanese-like domain-containing protein [Acidobacteriota bacterium]
MKRHSEVVSHDVRANPARPICFSLFVILVLAVIGCSQRTTEDWTALLARIRSEFPAVDQLPTEELARWLVEGREVVLLDTRSNEEYEVSHLEGALHAETVEQATEILERSASSPIVVVYCSVGYRSSALATQLMRRGFKVYNLEGSIFKWANEGRPLYRDGLPVEEVHPYDSTWGRFLSSRLWQKDSSQ